MSEKVALIPIFRLYPLDQCAPLMRSANRSPAICGGGSGLGGVIFKLFTKHEVPIQVVISDCMPSVRSIPGKGLNYQ